MLVCNDDVSFGAIDELVLKALPGGDAAATWANLTERFKPNMTSSLIAIKHKFTQSKLNGDKDPNTWVAKLQQLRACIVHLGGAMSNKDLILHVLNNLPLSYNFFIVNWKMNLEHWCR